MVLMRTRLLRAFTALLLGLAGCISANTTTTRSAAAPAPSERERISEIEARVARLEARPSDLEEEILAREVELVGLRTLYAPDHPSVTALEARIRVLGEARADQQRARRERMARRLEVERETLAATYAAEHQSLRKLDAQIAFLRSR